MRIHSTSVLCAHTCGHYSHSQTQRNSNSLAFLISSPTAGRCSCKFWKVFPLLSLLALLLLISSPKSAQNSFINNQQKGCLCYYVSYFMVILLLVLLLFPSWDAMIVQIPPPNSLCPSPAMNPCAPSSSPTSLTPPVAMTACARGMCTPAQGRAPRQCHSRNPHRSLDMVLKQGPTLGLDQAKGCF